MSDTIKTGGPAFPSEGEGHGNPKYHSEGMTLRDYFAGQALVMMPHMGCGCDLNPREVAWECYTMADAMIAARNANPEGEA